MPTLHGKQRCDDLPYMENRGWGSPSCTEDSVQWRTGVCAALHRGQKVRTSALCERQTV